MSFLRTLTALLFTSLLFCAICSAGNHDAASGCQTQRLDSRAAVVTPAAVVGRGLGPCAILSRGMHRYLSQQLGLS